MHSVDIIFTEINKEINKDFIEEIGNNFGESFYIIKTYHTVTNVFFR